MIIYKCNSRHTFGKNNETIYVNKMSAYVFVQNGVKSRYFTQK